jgi:twinkle protein
VNHAEEADSVLIGHEPCPKCGSRDNLARYSDGHAYCFSAGCDYRERGDGSRTYTPQTRSRMDLVFDAEIEAIPNRGLTRETAERFNYRVGTFAGSKAHFAPYYDDAGRMVAQKVRYKKDGEKEFAWLGDQHAAGLFGQQLVRDGGKMIVITEGELDALSVSQAQGNKWPALSLPNGAKAARRDLAKHVQWLERYERIILLFDMDDAGRLAVEEAAMLFSPGKVYVASLPLKDANEMVKAARSKELVDALWSAHPWKPEVLNELDDALIEEAAEEQPWGLPWPWLSLTKASYGIQRSALYTWGAGTGSGKTTLMKQLMLTAMRPELGEDHSELMPMPPPRPVACILYEEPVKRTLKTLGGMAMGKRVHVPGTEYDKGELREIIRALRPFLKSVSLKGARNWDTVKGTIRYLAVADGVRDFIIDPMTALTAGDENERLTLDGIMSELADLAEALDVTIHLVFHLTTPEGKSHEEGGRVLEKQFRGSRAVAFWSHFLMGLERNKQDPDSPTIVRGLKDRPTGDAVGPLIALTYDKETGLLVEVPMPDGEGSPFRDESNADL